MKYWVLCDFREFHIVIATKEPNWEDYNMNVQGGFNTLREAKNEIYEYFKCDLELAKINLSRLSKFRKHDCETENDI